MNRIDRRFFIGSMGALVTLSGCANQQRTFYMPPATVRRPRTIPAGEKMNVACIGVGGKGKQDTNDMKGENVVALCDVDEKNLQAMAKNFPNAKLYKDYRKMFSEMDEQIDAVTISTPDHTHYPAAMMAIKMGKHAFVQKPITRTLWECRMLTEAAHLHGVSTQMGNQGHSSEGTRLLVEWTRAGAIGTVREIHLWTDRPTSWGTPCGTDRPTDTPPTPETLDWNLWLGTAPKRPYHPNYAPKKWRSWYDFGAGALGDMGCHLFDATFWALDLGWPEWVSAETSDRKDETFPKSAKVTYQFPAKGSRPPVKVFWYDGGNMPERPADLEEGRSMGPSIGGQLIIGDKGKMLASHNASTVRLIPETAMREFAKAGVPPKTLPRIDGNHGDDWIQSCKEDGHPACSNFDYAGPLTEMVLLGVLAVRTGEKVVCDNQTLKVTSHPEFNQYIREPYRKF